MPSRREVKATREDVERIIAAGYAVKPATIHQTLGNSDNTFYLLVGVVPRPYVVVKETRRGWEYPKWSTIKPLIKGT